MVEEEQKGIEKDPDNVHGVINDKMIINDVEIGELMLAIVQ